MTLFISNYYQIFSVFRSLIILSVGIIVYQKLNKIKSQTKKRY